MAERIPGSEAQRAPASRPVRAVAHLLWPSDADPVVLGALGMWGTAGDTADGDAHRVVTRALAERLGPPGFREADKWVKRHRRELDELRRCWRVEAARADLLGLWEAIDNESPSFKEQFDGWVAACVVAAEAAVAVWAV